MKRIRPVLMAGAILLPIIGVAAIIWKSRSSTPSSRGGDDRAAAREVAKIVPTWEVGLPYGTHSSPRRIEFGDAPEMLIAFGDERARVGGVMAVDVATGTARWTIETGNEMFALPIPLSSGAAKTLPWVFGGRAGELYAIDVASGEVIWQFQGDGGDSHKSFNFYAGRELQDVDGDGVADFLVPHGGDYSRGPREERAAGNLLVVSGADGTIVHQMEVPDGRETYCSPLVWHRKDGDQIVFGTGGETFPGSLWSVAIGSVRRGTLDGVRLLVPSVGDKGAVAPPSLADLDGDGEADVVAAPFDGRVVVISGDSFEPLWQYSPLDVNETQSSPAIGDFDGDGRLEVVQIAQLGVFPGWRRSILRAFDGENGDLLWEHETLNALSTGSPLALDVDEDGRDEVFFVESDPRFFSPHYRGQTVWSKLQIAHVDEQRIETLGKLPGFCAATGWLGDADEDGELEWWLTVINADSTGKLLRVDLQRPAPSRIAWGGYLGTDHDGFYP